jgi:hypothetical protein
MALLIKKILAVLITILSGIWGPTLIKEALTEEVRSIFLTVVLLVSVFALLFIRIIILNLVFS